MKSEPGTYALIFRSQSTQEIQVGRWGLLSVAPGYYVYVGSAFGPGGVKARVVRHCNETKSKHWHVDYLREAVNPVGAWYCYCPKQLEHQWAKTLYEMENISAIKGFGCSDCKCYSHLFAIASEPKLAQFASIVDSEVKSWLYRSDG